MGVEELALIVSVGALVVALWSLRISHKAASAHVTNAATNTERLEQEKAERLTAHLRVMPQTVRQDRRSTSPSWVFPIVNDGPHRASALRFSYTVDEDQFSGERLFDLDPGATQEFDVDGKSSWPGEDITLSLSWTDGRGTDQTTEFTVPLTRPPDKPKPFVL